LGGLVLTGDQPPHPLEHRAREQAGRGPGHQADRLVRHLAHHAHAITLSRGVTSRPAKPQTRRPKPGAPTPAPQPWRPKPGQDPGRQTRTGVPATAAVTVVPPGPDSMRRLSLSWRMSHSPRPVEAVRSTGTEPARSGSGS